MLSTLLHALSPLGFLGMGAGGIALALVVFNVIPLPDFVRKWVIMAGAVVLAAAAVYQLGYAKATFAARERQLEANIRAEKARAIVAEEIVKEQSTMIAQAEKDAAASAKRMKELSDAAAKGPNPVCVDRGLARRLRSL